MGQYYKPVLIAQDGSMATLYSWDYDNGMKLMEHSWIGNDLVNAVQSLIINCPKQVAWMGDYADSKDGSPYEKQVESHMTWDEFMEIYRKAVDSDECRVEPPVMCFGLRSAGWFLVNHTKRVYIDLTQYVRNNAYFEEWRDVDGFHRQTTCVHPLPLLTACGNNRGGGDYHANHPGIESVGTWAFDLIELTQCAPDKDYESVMFKFDEKPTA